ncbi:hypothetical protein BJ912DRAFT_952784 [Pholiota molesta]|nr:hypothetical protein BJ912DRAFT_952784 [Pholiota molesta]
MMRARMWILMSAGMWTGLRRALLHLRSSLLPADANLRSSPRVVGGRSVVLGPMGELAAQDQEQVWGADRRWR